MRVVARLFLLSLALLCSGCDWRTPGPTMENYERVQVGMEYDEVVKILGKPSSSGSGYLVGDGKAEVFNSRRWSLGDGASSIEIVFVSDPLLRLIVKEKRIDDGKDNKPAHKESANKNAS